MIIELLLQTQKSTKISRSYSELHKIKLSTIELEGISEEIYIYLKIKIK